MFYTIHDDLLFVAGNEKTDHKRISHLGEEKNVKSILKKLSINSAHELSLLHKFNRDELLYMAKNEISFSNHDIFHPQIRYSAVNAFYVGNFIDPDKL